MLSLWLTGVQPCASTASSCVQTISTRAAASRSSKPRASATIARSAPPRLEPRRQYHMGVRQAPGRLGETAIEPELAPRRVVPVRHQRLQRRGERLYDVGLQSRGGLDVARDAAERAAIDRRGRPSASPKPA